MPNAFAYLAIFSFPLIVIWIFRRNPLPAALIWTFVSSYLLLPGAVSIDFPMLPQINKVTVASVSAFVLSMVALATQRRMLQQGHAVETRFYDAGGWLPKSPLLKTLLLLHIIAPILTVFSNPDGIMIGGVRFLPGLRTYDAMSVALSGLMSVIPFLLARRFLGSTDAQLAILKALVIALAAYAILALVEVRMSPQVNRWVYGYFPHNFVRHIRGNGFRPLVFLSHGLVLGLLLTMALLASLGLWRILGRKAPGYLLFAIPWLAVTLVLSKTLGALLIAMIFVPMVVFFGMRLQLFVAAMVAIIILTYPMLRGADLVPTERILELARSIDPNRASSLAVRFGNENRLLAHANERPILGWGGWGRSRVYDEWTGADISITDGLWAITVGVGGWVGYLVRFSLLGLPLILLAWRRRALGLSMVTSILCLVHAANLVDLIPNSGLTVITWLITGALWGRYEMGKEAVDNPSEDATEPVDHSPYRRYFGHPKSARQQGAFSVGRVRARPPNGLVTRRRT